MTYPGYFGGRPLSQRVFHNLTADSLSRPVGRLVSGLTCKTASKRPSNKLPPFALRHGFWHTTAPVDFCDGSSRFYPPVCYQLSQAGTSSLLRIHLPPRTASVRPRVAPCASPYSMPDRSAIKTIRGFPSYLWLPVNYAILNHTTGLIRYRALRYLARLPTRSAESGLRTLCAVHFLSLPSDPAVAGNALAIRIVFPLIGATPVSCNRPGLPAPLGKPKKEAPGKSGGLLAWGWF